MGQSYKVQLLQTLGIILLWLIIMVLKQFMWMEYQKLLEHHQVLLNIHLQILVVDLLITGGTQVI